ncbi:unnamed protein product [Urochloa humidicola]
MARTSDRLTSTSFKSQMAPSSRRGEPAAVAKYSLRRSTRLALQRSKSPASPAQDVVVSAPARRRRPFLPFRRSHDQSCLAGHVALHQVVFVHAWPGTGKSSQVPRVLHATGHSPVICSQTYRLAAESAAAQAAADMSAGEVAVALDDGDGRAPAAGTAAVTYTTHHALLRELTADPVLSRYGAVVIDEADDGMLLTSAVLGRVRHAAARRPDLRLIICTHGTMFYGDEALHAFFPDAQHLWFRTNTGLCPREYLPDPVTNHVAAAVATVRRVHSAEPPGDVLVFLPSRGDIDAAERLLLADPSPPPGIVTRRLYDSVPVHLISDVLGTTPDGERKVVLATDVADSAVFVEGIRYIVDSGYRCTDNAPPSLIIPSSLSPARMFRALKPSVRSGYHIKGWDNRGKCFCLYTMEEGREMVRTGSSPLRTRTDDVDCLAGIVLVLKDLGIAGGGNDVESFDLIIPPRPETLQRALAALVAAGAVGLDGEVSEEGRRMAREDYLGRCYF